jgi:hypothetical protein
MVPDRAKPRYLKKSCFDYNTVSESAAKFLRDQAERIRRHCTTSIVQIGKALMCAKRYLSHGAFLDWVEGETGIPARTAQAYMRVAEWASDKCAAVTHLPPSALYLLSASNTPKAFTDNVLERIEAGEHIKVSEIRKQLKSIRDNKCEPSERADQCGPDDGMTVFDPKVEAASGVGGASAMKEVVTILARDLTPSEFTKVRDIVTSCTVLNDPHLGQNIALAFSLRMNVPASYIK